MTGSVEELLREAEQHLAGERYDLAVRHLHHALRFPEYHREVYEKYAFALRMLGDTRGAERVERVLTQPQRAESFFQLGSAFVEEGMYGQALAPLYRSYQLAPGEAAICYWLGYSLMKEFQLEKALLFMRRAYEKEPRLPMVYSMAYLYLLRGESEQADPFLLEMEKIVQREGEGTERLKYLREFRERLIAHPPKDIRDWHFVQYGTALLRVFHDDFPDVPEDPAHGRYMWVTLTYRQVAAALKALACLFESLETKTDYSSISYVSQEGAPLALALGEMLQLPVSAFSPANAGRPEIVLAVHSEEVNRIARSCIDRPESLIFSLTVDWTRETVMLPDVIGYFAQVSFLPWQERLEFRENGAAVRVPADDRPPEQIAKEIRNEADKVEESFLSSIARYTLERNGLWKLGRNTDCPRKRFLVESPLGGARLL
jgi:tetratricopeptide (TPR) repeat protein